MFSWWSKTLYIRMETVSRIMSYCTYGTKSHDFKDPDGEGEIEDNGDCKNQHERVQAFFPPTVHA